MAKCPDCPPEGAPGWVVTYGDMMTLLLCFFVLLFSFSTMDLQIMKSLKESFSGAFGILKGHSAIAGPGVSSQPQKYSSKLFDQAMEKLKRAKSDKFPNEKIDFLNSLEGEITDAEGLIDKKIEEESIAVDNAAQTRETVKEKEDNQGNQPSNQLQNAESIKQFRADQIAPKSVPSMSTKNERDAKTEPSKTPAKQPSQDVDPERNSAELPPVKKVLQRGDQFQQKMGDGSKSRKNVGRNQPMMGNPGENELEKESTGHELKHRQRMDRVEGKGEKKRFDFPVPKKEPSDSSQVNVSGQVKSTQSDANRGVIVEKIFPAGLLFEPKSSRLLPKADHLIEEFTREFYEKSGDGYFQVEGYTDSSAPQGDYPSNRDLTMQMAIAFVTRCLENHPRISPSKFAPVGWGDVYQAKENQEMNNRLEIRLIKRKY